MYTKIIIKNFYFFLYNIYQKMRGKNVNFDDKKL